MSKLFRRVWRVTLGDTNAIATTGLRVAFKVKATLKKDPNTAEISVTNLSSDSRSKLEKKGTLVTLEGGYEGGMGVLFVGDTRTVDHTRDGPNWVSVFRCGDGEANMTQKRVSKTFPPGTKLKDAIESMASSLGISKGNIVEALKKNLNFETFKNGFSFSGNAGDGLQKLAEAAGLNFSIQRNAIQLAVTGEPVNTDVFVLTSSTGLVGSPDHSAPQNKNSPPILKCRSLLNPKLCPGHEIRIEAEGVKGSFIILSLEHTGDSHGQDWFTDIECVARKT